MVREAGYEAQPLSDDRHADGSALREKEKQVGRAKAAMMAWGLVLPRRARTLHAEECRMLMLCWPCTHLRPVRCTAPLQFWRRKFLWALAFSLPLFLISMVLM